MDSSTSQAADGVLVRRRGAPRSAAVAGVGSLTCEATFVEAHTVATPVVGAGETTLFRTDAGDDIVLAAWGRYPEGRAGKKAQMED
jgi:hypothetical protein